MMSFFSMFKKSAMELRSVLCIALTGLLIAVSMLIESFSIDFAVFKVNFAFIAIAIIGMLFGPVVALPAGFACDIVGHMVSGGSAFLPAYTLAAGLQGLIYGVCLYCKNDRYSIKLTNNKSGKTIDITLYIRAVIARLLDVIIINLLINTKLNLHYGFIPKEAYSEAIVARIAKNVLELVADVPLMFVILPAALIAYKRIVPQRRRGEAVKNT